MASQCHSEGMPGLGLLGSRIATKSAFLASRTARAAAAQHGAEQSRLQNLCQDQNAELERIGAQILSLRDTNKDLSQKNNDLQNVAAAARNALAEKSLELQHARDTTRSTLAQKETEQYRLERFSQEQASKLRRKDAQILDLNSAIGRLTLRNSNSEGVAIAQDALAKKTMELERATIAVAEVAAARSAADHHVIKLSATVETLERDSLRFSERVQDAARVHTKTEGDLRDARDMLSKSQATTNRLMRGDRLSSAAIKGLEERLSNLTDVHARTKKDLGIARNASAEFEAAKAAAESDNNRSLKKIKVLQEREGRLTKELAQATAAHARVEQDLRSATYAISEVEGAKLAAESDSSRSSSKANS